MYYRGHPGVYQVVILAFKIADIIKLVWISGQQVVQCVDWLVSCTVFLQQAVEGE